MYLSFGKESGSCWGFFFLVLLLLCLGLLISLLNGSYWKGGDCLLGCCQLSNLPTQLHGKGERWPSQPNAPKVPSCLPHPRALTSLPVIHISCFAVGETVHPLAICRSQVMNNIVWPAGLVSPDHSIPQPEVLSFPKKISSN